MIPLLKKGSVTDSENTTLLIRVMIGAIFLSEGIQKYLFPEVRGSGRFESIGLEKGFGEMTHASRTDFSMLIGSIFLLIKGEGKWSLDLKLFN